MRTMDELVKNLSWSMNNEALNELNQMLDGAECGISFFGTRFIRYDNKNFALPEIAEKVYQISEKCLERGLYEADRLEWISLAKKISAFYVKTDEAKNKSHILTQIFIAIRELGFFSSNFIDKFRPTNRVVHAFRAYSEKELAELEKIVGLAKDIETPYFVTPPRVVATEEAIRTRFNLKKEPRLRVKVAFEREMQRGPQALDPITQLVMKILIEEIQDSELVEEIAKHPEFRNRIQEDTFWKNIARIVFNPEDLFPHKGKFLGLGKEYRETLEKAKLLGQPKKSDIEICRELRQIYKETYK